MSPLLLSLWNTTCPDGTWLGEFGMLHLLDWSMICPQFPPVVTLMEPINLLVANPCWYMNMSSTADSGSDPFSHGTFQFNTTMSRTLIITNIFSDLTLWQR